MMFIKIVLKRTEPRAWYFLRN